MEDNVKESRRQLLKMGSVALAAAPMIGFNTSAFAHQNTSVRTALKFQNYPNGDKRGSNCMNFIPNKNKPTDNGAVHGCRLYPGDDEIVPNGYCLGFIAKSK